MSCPEFQDLLTDQPENSFTDRANLDAHLLTCVDCREYLETLQQLDADLASIFSGLRTAPDFDNAVLANIQMDVRLAKPSVIPEVLDLIGWLATAIGLVVVAWISFPLPVAHLAMPAWQFAALLSFALAATITATWNSLRTTPRRGL